MSSNLATPTNTASPLAPSLLEFTAMISATFQCGLVLALSGGRCLKGRRVRAIAFANLLATAQRRDHSKSLCHAIKCHWSMMSHRTGCNP